MISEFLSLEVPHGLALVEHLDLLCVADRENMRVVCPRYIYIKKTLQNTNYINIQ